MIFYFFIMEVCISPYGQSLEGTDGSGAWLYECNGLTIPIKNPIESVISITVKKAVIPNFFWNVDYWPEIPGEGYTFYISFIEQTLHQVHTAGYTIPPGQYDQVQMEAALNTVLDQWAIQFGLNRGWITLSFDPVSQKWQWDFVTDNLDFPEITFQFSKMPALAKTLGFWPQDWSVGEIAPLSWRLQAQQPWSEKMYFPALYLIIPEMETENSITKTWVTADNVAASLTFDYPQSDQRYLAYMPSSEKEIMLSYPHNFIQITPIFKVLFGGKMYAVPFHCLEYYLEVLLETVQSSNPNDQMGLY